ncbi:MAG TPA: cysteine hydrolase, partial [Candidatus Saccharimonadales bacterium]|nr:cysteine hydrolase [Candidatus Saccharimonadales bacterium]
GRLHAYETIDPRKTALVVIDLDIGTVKRDDRCEGLVEPINTLAAAVRKSGGVVAWVTTPITKLGENFIALIGAKRAQDYLHSSQPAAPGGGVKLWPALGYQAGDLVAAKKGASAFFPGKCNLHEQLRALGIDTLLITGTVTNVCCESSGRDAAELDYKVTMVSDCLMGHSYGLHEASLGTFYRIFGDVRPSYEVIRLLSFLA